MLRAAGQGRERLLSTKNIGDQSVMKRSPTLACPSRKCRPTNKSFHLLPILFNTAGRLREPVAAIFLVQEPGEDKLMDTGLDLPLGNFAD
jgi:hypothetical protein